VVDVRNVDRAAQGNPELVLLVGRLGAVKVVPSIQLIVAQELVDVSVELIGAGLDAGVENGAISPSELRAVGIGLHLEFLQSIHGRLNNVTGVVQQIRQIRVIVDAIQQDVVRIGTPTIRAESVTS